MDFGMSERPFPINDIRSTSRRLVRELGFMGGDFAGTDLPPSAVHALIEIEACPRISARDLGKMLRLEKSSISRMLRKLVLSGDVLEKRTKRIVVSSGCASPGEDRSGSKPSTPLPTDRYQTHCRGSRLRMAKNP